MMMVALFLAGCGDDETGATCDSSQVSGVLSQMGNATTGQAVFGSCGTTACHGTTGSDGMGGDLAVRVPALDDTALATTIYCGTDTPAIAASMPPQSEAQRGTLSDKEIADVIAYLRMQFPNP
jgi:mono/diheme cytochrome c family protein